MDRRVVGHQRSLRRLDLLAGLVVPGRLGRECYYAAGNVSRQGGDVYNPGQLFAEEDRLYGAPHPGAGGFSHTTFANPPLFAAALKLIAPLPKTVFHLLWLAITAAGGVIALLALLEAMRWRGRSLPLVFLMTCSPMLLALFVGNISTLLLLSWSTGLLLWTRQQPVLAGTALSVCWLKPSVGLPIAAALVLAAPAGTDRPEDQGRHRPDSGDHRPAGLADRDHRVQRFGQLGRRALRTCVRAELVAGRDGLLDQHVRPGQPSRAVARQPVDSCFNGSFDVCPGRHPAHRTTIW
jgi:Glycosyltransferase family 87